MTEVLVSTIHCDELNKCKEMDDCLSLDTPNAVYMSESYPMELETDEDETELTSVTSTDSTTKFSGINEDDDEATEYGLLVGTLPDGYIRSAPLPQPRTDRTKAEPVIRPQSTQVRAQSTMHNQHAWPQSMPAPLKI